MVFPPICFRVSQGRVALTNFHRAASLNREGE